MEKGKKSKKFNIKIRSGDVILTDNINFAHDKNGDPFYNNNPSIKKTRPFIVISDDNENQVTVLGIFGTSDTDAIDPNDPYTVCFDPSDRTGLSKTTYFDITQMSPVHIGTVKNKIGELSEEEVEELRYLLMKYLGIIRE